MNELTCPRLRGGDECQSAVYKERAKKNAVNAQFQLSHNEGNVCSVHRVNKEFLYRPQLVDMVPVTRHLNF